MISIDDVLYVMGLHIEDCVKKGLCADYNTENEIKIISYQNCQHLLMNVSGMVPAAEDPTLPLLGKR